MMHRFFMGIASLSTAKTIFWKRSGLLMSLRFGDSEGRSEVTLKDPLEIYAGRGQPFARSCRCYFRIAVSLRSAGHRRRPIECPSSSLGGLGAKRAYPPVHSWQTLVGYAPSALSHPTG